jgi:release factor glutamine methyltransferase
MTVADRLREATRFLEGAGSPSARLDAEVLLAHLLGVRRVDLYLVPERSLSPEQEESYRALLERRALGEPVSYLVGRKEFYGLTFVVDRRVLIPRPETEELVDRALWCARTLGRPDLLLADIGTGCGCIAVALAVHLPQAHVYATDLSPEAIEVAWENVRRHRVQERVTLLLGDLCQPLPAPVDLLVSNPPYTIWERLPWGITGFEPRIALDGGKDGLEVLRRLIGQIAWAVRPGGFALLEFGDGQEEAVRRVARSAFPGVPMVVGRDLAGLPRVLQLGPLPAR